MTVFVADHTGRMTASSSHLRPIHIGAALSDPARIGPEPDTTVPQSLSAFPVFADLRLYDYITKAYAEHSEYICIQQRRRMFFLGRPRPWQRALTALQRSVSGADEGQIEISARHHEIYLGHLRRVTDRTLGAELGEHTFIANRWSFGEVSVEDQYLGSIADLYPGQDEYVEAWHDMRFALNRIVDPTVVDRALGSTAGYFNNCFVARWEEFQLYHGFLFAVLDDLAHYRHVYRLFGYLAERVFCVYLVQQAEARRNFTVRSKPMMFVA